MSYPMEYGVPTHRCALQLRLGIARGFFLEEGIDLSLRVVFGGPEIAQALDSGTIKMGELGTPPGLTAIAKGARFRIVGSGVRRSALQFFVVRTLFSCWEDLRGAHLGVLSPGSCSDWYLRKMVAHYGLVPDKDVRIVGLRERYPEILDLLHSEELDGAVLSEPHASIGEQAGDFRIWVALNRWAGAPRMQWTVAVANVNFLSDQPELVASILRGCKRSYRYAAAHQDEWANFGARYYGISPEIMRRSIRREIDDLHLDCELDIPGLKAAIALQKELRSIPPALGFADVIDRRFCAVSRAE